MSLLLRLAFVLVAAVGCVQAQTAVFGFDSSSTWTSTLGTTAGYPASPAAADGNTNTILTAAQTSSGITLTFTADLGGAADYATRNLYDLAINPVGFNFSSKATYNDLAVDGVTNTVTATGNLVDYQRWTFSFSEPVKLTSLYIDDIDNNTAASMTFWDFLGAEAYSTATPGAPGTGIDPVWDLAATTGLIEGTISTPDGSILFLTPSDATNNPTNDPNYRAGITFGDVYVQSFVLYAFTKNEPGVPATGTDTIPLVTGNVSNTHRMAIFNSTVEVQPIPEASSALLICLAAAGVFWRRRRA